MDVVGIDVDIQMWMKLSQGLFRWKTLILEFLDIYILLPQCLIALVCLESW